MVKAISRIQKNLTYNESTFSSISAQSTSRQNSLQRTTEPLVQGKRGAWRYSPLALDRYMEVAQKWWEAE